MVLTLIPDAILTEDLPELQSATWVYTLICLTKTQAYFYRATIPYCKTLVHIHPLTLQYISVQSAIIPLDISKCSIHHILNILYITAILKKLCTIRFFLFIPQQLKLKVKIFALRPVHALWTMSIILFQGDILSMILKLFYNQLGAGGRTLACPHPRIEAFPAKLINRGLILIPKTPV